MRANGQAKILCRRKGVGLAVLLQARINSTGFAENEASGAGKGICSPGPPVPRLHQPSGEDFACFGGLVGTGRARVGQREVEY